MLLDLLNGRCTREEAADWAAAWVSLPDPHVHDPVVWEALTDLAGADLLTVPDGYLHDERDIESWLLKIPHRS